MKDVRLKSDEARLVRMARALGNPLRLRLLRYMVANPQCITGDLVQFSGLAQSTVSQHLKVLRQAGWVTGEVEGPATCYCLDAQAMAWFADEMQRLSKGWSQICCPPRPAVKLNLEVAR
ncbi:MAG TPA: metalloregulator ArsR/SmtB family transcription factor [Anaerolineales bacterium]|nr:metalloregulator ArsR/SmtB family transcription factor [Anaerolineales bacterium]